MEYDHYTNANMITFFQNQSASEQYLAYIFAELCKGFQSFVFTFHFKHYQIHLSLQLINMMKMQLLGVVLVVLLVLVGNLRADSSDEGDEILERVSRGAISWPCTVKCGNWWKCRITGFFFRKCKKPAGCDCSQFAWEGQILRKHETFSLPFSLSFSISCSINTIISGKQ